MSEILSSIGIKIDPRGAKSGSDKVVGSLGRINDSAKRLRNQLTGLFAGFSAAALIRSTVTIADEMTGLKARLDLVTESFQDLKSVQNEILQVSLETRSDLASTTDLYIKLSRALRSTGESSEEILGITRTINEAFRISGGATAERTGAILQLNQALASGKLSGQEFNSVSEQGTRILQLLQDSLDKTSGELRKMANDGLLTTEVLIKAFQEQAQTITDESAKIPLRVGEAFTNLSSIYKTYIAEVDEANGITGRLAKSIQFLSDNLSTILGVFGSLAKIVAIVAGARGMALLISSLRTVNLSLTAASGQIAGFTVKLTVMQTVASVASRTMKGLFAFLGGGVGVITAVATAMFVFKDSLFSTEQSTASLVERNMELLRSMEDVATHELRQSLAETQDKIVSLTLKIQSQALWFKEHGISADKATIATKGLTKESKKLAAQATALITKIQGIVTEQKKQKKSMEDLDKESKKQSTAVEKWIKLAKDQIEKLKERNVELLKGKKGLIEYRAEQAIKLSNDEAEIETIKKLRDETISLTETIATHVEAVRVNTKAQNEIDAAYQRYIKRFAPLKVVEEQRAARLADLNVLLKSNKISQEEYDEKVKRTNEDLDKEANSIRNVGNALEKTDTLFGRFFANIKKGFKQAAQSFFANLSGKNGSNAQAGAIGGAASFLGSAAQSFSDNDSTFRAINDIAAKIPIPWVQAIAAIISLLDGFAGGKLLGTNFEVTGTGFEGRTTPSGVRGFQFLDESRQRSFFRGTSRRRTESDLNTDIISVLAAINDTGIQVAQQAANALGVQVATLVTGEIAQNFDPDGNLTSSIVTVLGKTYNEGIQEFGRRIAAENLLAQIAQTVGDVDTTEFIQSGVVDAENGDLTPTFDEVDIVMNEVHAIARRWREDSELLLEGAQFLLIAQGDILNGFNLLENGSLTDITNLIEDMNKGGETLTDTYARVAGAFVTFDSALELMGVTLDKTRIEIIDMAVEISEAAGGLPAAQALWSSYFKNFFTEQELIVAQLDKVNEDIAEMTSELGEDITFENFRERFTEALPDLSPEEIAQWLKLGNALAISHGLAGQLTEEITILADSLADYTNLANDMADANLSLAEQLDNNFISIDALISAYDGSIESEQALANSLAERYQLELQFLEQIKQASISIDQQISNSIDNIRATQQTPEERFEFLTSRAEALAAGIGDITDPEELKARIAEINRLQAEAFGLLGEEQQAQLADGFIEFLEEINRRAQDQLAGLDDRVGGDSESIVSRIGGLLETTAEAQQTLIDEFSTVIDQMGTAIDTFDASTRRFELTRIGVDIEQVNLFQPDVSNA